MGRFLHEKTLLQGQKIGKCFLSGRKTFKVCVICMISLLNQFFQLSNQEQITAFSHKRISQSGIIAQTRRGGVDSLGDMVARAEMASCRAGLGWGGGLAVEQGARLQRCIKEERSSSPAAHGA